MSEKKINAWNIAQYDRQKAENWNALPNGKRYMQDTFSISVAHCTPPKLVRAGQQSAGGQNYWETEEAFNTVILQWLVKNWNKAYPEIIEMMKDKENQALVDCQEYVSKMQQMIDQAKGG